jgi:hypothetical protein
MLTTASLLGIRKWKTDGKLTVHLANHLRFLAELLASAPAVLKALTLAPTGAPDDSLDGLPNAKAVLTELQDHGLIEGPPWVFTLKGRECVECGVRLSEPERVLTRAPEGADLDFLSPAQLIVELEHHGWQHMEVEGRKSVQNAKAKPYECDAEEPLKRWYTRAGETVSRFYMLALLRLLQARLCHTSRATTSTSRCWGSRWHRAAGQGPTRSPSRSPPMPIGQRTTCRRPSLVELHVQVEVKPDDAAVSGRSTMMGCRATPWSRTVTAPR